MNNTLLSPLLAAILLSSAPALGASKGVTLGVGAGTTYSPTEVGGDEAIGARFGWMFHVDIPLLDTFYIAPSTTLYELGDGNAATDVDMSFKFIVPLGSSHLGAGFMVGLTNAGNEYETHVGGMGTFAFNLVSNLDLFVQAQYKRLFVEPEEVDDVHIFGGVGFKL